MTKSVSYDSAQLRRTHNHQLWFLLLGLLSRSALQFAFQPLDLVLNCGSELSESVHCVILCAYEVFEVRLKWFLEVSDLCVVSREAGSGGVQREVNLD